VEDKGSSISGAINAIIKKGACLKETYPYDPNLVNDPLPAETYDKALSYKILKAWNIHTDANEFTYVLSKGFPIVFGCKLMKAFFNSRGRGIIPVPASSIR